MDRRINFAYIIHTLKKNSQIKFSRLLDFDLGSTPRVSFTMASWDDEDFDVSTTRVAPIVASKGKWEGEDEDEDDIPVHLLRSFEIRDV